MRAFKLSGTLLIIIIYTKRNDSVSRVSAVSKEFVAVYQKKKFLPEMITSFRPTDHSCNPNL